GTAARLAKAGGDLHQRELWSSRQVAAGRRHLVGGFGTLLRRVRAGGERDDGDGDDEPMHVVPPSEGELTRTPLYRGEPCPIPGPPSIAARQILWNNRRALPVLSRPDLSEAPTRRCL